MVSSILFEINILNRLVSQSINNKIKKMSQNNKRNKNLPKILKSS